MAVVWTPIAESNLDDILYYVSVVDRRPETGERKVSATLQHHRGLSVDGEEPSEEDFTATVDSSGKIHPATIIAGRYKLVEPIGEGGMGTVWLAKQKEPVKRRVAIKLIKAGMDSRAVLARFEAERQALAGTTIRLRLPPRPL